MQYILNVISMAVVMCGDSSSSRNDSKTTEYGLEC
jgi:hypothetical protein